MLTNAEKVGGSLKSRIYDKKDLKSNPAQLFALVTEASKWSGVLKEVVERSGVLKDERKVLFVSLSCARYWLRYSLSTLHCLTISLSLCITPQNFLLLQLVCHNTNADHDNY